MLTIGELIALAGVVVAAVVGIGGWIASRSSKRKVIEQNQIIKGGQGIQSGGDVTIHDK
ncbi:MULTISPECIES: hypothetical protein [Brucella]|uniref:hypothetical protein n=1 Tax=Brucella TaxID=234 RepID=UPI001377FFF2|nr:hypothetical protein [Brucella rhizosphaerae]